MLQRTRSLVQLNRRKGFIMSIYTIIQRRRRRRNTQGKFSMPHVLSQDNQAGILAYFVKLTRNDRHIDEIAQIYNVHFLSLYFFLDILVHLVVLTKCSMSFFPLSTVSLNLPQLSQVTCGIDYLSSAFRCVNEWQTSVSFAQNWQRLNFPFKVQTLQLFKTLLHPFSPDMLHKVLKLLIKLPNDDP